MSMEVLKKIRSLLGISPSEMARRLGKSKQNYNRLEKKARFLSFTDVKIIRELSRDADVSDRELLDLIEEEGERIKKAKIKASKK